MQVHTLIKMLEENNSKLSDGQITMVANDQPTIVNGISQDDENKLISVLAENTTLKHLDLSHNMLSKSGIIKLFQTLPKNKCLESIKLSYYDPKLFEPCDMDLHTAIYNNKRYNIVTPEMLEQLAFNLPDLKALKSIEINGLYNKTVVADVSDLLFINLAKNFSLTNFISTSSFTQCLNEAQLLALNKILKRNSVNQLDIPSYKQLKESNSSQFFTTPTTTMTNPRQSTYSI